MSVQGTAGATRRIRDDRHKTLKVVAFWGFLFLASFIFGMMIVSPLITASGLGEQKAAPPDTQAANAQPIAPQPSPTTAAANSQISDEKRHTKRVKPDIELSVEPNSSSTQTPGSTDVINAGDSSTALSETRDGKSNLLDTDTPKPSRRAARTRRATDTQDEEPSGTYSVEQDKQLVPDESDRLDSSDKPKSRTHRPTRRSRTNSAEKNSEVQKGESIDQ